MSSIDRLEFGAYSLGRLVEMTQQTVKDIQDAVYSSISEESLVFVKQMRERGDSCEEIGQQMKGVAHGDWPETFNKWVGYFFCEAGSRYYGQKLSETPWKLGNIPE